MIRLKLSLPCPANALYRALPMFVRGKSGKGRMIAKQVLSKRARLKRDQIVAEIWKQLGGRPTPMTGPVQVQITVYPRDKRTPDSECYQKHCLDILQHASVYENDRQVERVSSERMPNPEFPGHLVVEITEIP